MTDRNRSQNQPESTTPHTSQDEKHLGNVTPGRERTGPSRDRDSADDRRRSRDDGNTGGNREDVDVGMQSDETAMVDDPTDARRDAGDR